MPKKLPVSRRSDCPISISLDLFGDRWTLLVIRDLLFKGRREFGELLGAEEGMATNVLSDRLGKLEAAEVIIKTSHPDDARKFQYVLTDKGLDLTPILVEMIIWAANHDTTAAPATVVRRMTKGRAAYVRDVRAQYVRARAERG